MVGRGRGGSTVEEVETKGNVQAELLLLVGQGRGLGAEATGEGEGVRVAEEVQAYRRMATECACGAVCGAVRFAVRRGAVRLVVIFGVAVGLREQSGLLARLHARSRMQTAAKQASRQAGRAGRAGRAGKARLRGPIAIRMTGGPLIFCFFFFPFGAGCREKRHTHTSRALRDLLAGWAGWAGWAGCFGVARLNSVRVGRQGTHRSPVRISCHDMTKVSFLAYKQRSIKRFNPALPPPLCRYRTLTPCLPGLLYCILHRFPLGQALHLSHCHGCMPRQPKSTEREKPPRLESLTASPPPPTFPTL